MKTVGVITIGQAPRDDVVPDLEKILGPEVQVVQAGALDGLSREAIASLAPASGQYPLITRLLDGASVVIAKEAIIPLLQGCLDRLAAPRNSPSPRSEAPGATAFAILCTGVFPRFRSIWPVLEPDRLLFGVAQAIVGAGPLGVIIPIEGQRAAATAHWSRIVPEPTLAVASPYADAATLVEASERLRGAGARVVVMDCMGFTAPARKVVRDITGAAVLLPSSLVARVLADIA